MNRRQMFGAAVAMAAAGMLVANASFAGDKPAEKAAAKKVKCAGNNECKGKGACGGEGHACAGKNECKGKGWTMVESEKACTDAKGTVVKEEKKGK